MQTVDTVAKARAELERQNRLYAMLSHIDRTIVRTSDPHELYRAACRIAIEQGGFSLAWIELVKPGTDQVVPVVSAGLATIAQLKYIQEPGQDQKPKYYSALASSQGTSTPIQPEMTTSGLIAHWGLSSGIAFPIRLEGNIVGGFNVALTEPDFFGATEINLLTEVVEDISFALDSMRREEKHVAAETKMRYLVYYDSQTGMPSRTLFDERLVEACNHDATEIVAVLIANLRRYHGIVQLLGPETGLDVIRTAATKLESTLHTVFLARLSASKFAVILRNPEGMDRVEELAWQMHRVLSEPIRTQNQEVYLDPFVGIATYPQDGEPAELLKHALHAASDAESISCCRFYFADMDEGSRRRLSLDTALRHALERHEFLLHFQPQVDLTTGRIVGAEALLRWQSRDYGLVLPQDFIPLLEESGLISQVGEWVLEEACRYARKWQLEGLAPCRMAVNLSARQFLNNDIRATVRRTLAATGLDPEWLELELTESVVLLNADSVIKIMYDLNGDGVSHALDDFGTGYSSLSYLQRLPVARIKIDRTFITNLTSNPSDAAIVRALVGMAHSLNLAVIAEGVETEGQLGFLRGVGCEAIQGYFFSRPLPASEFSALLREERRIPPRQIDKPEQVLLLVDDEPNILSALARALRPGRYRIVCATTTREAFDLMAIHNPGVIISDQRMPEMTGTEFLRRVRQLYPDAVRLVLSGYTELNSVIDAVNQGAVYKFLPKPWEDDTLRESIRDAFIIYDLHRQNRELSRLLQERQTE
ncbi:MAG: EAL domain-containing protein [Methylomonas sp.]|nr:EAL domain-containing protein [Methylomonas sp.]